jgi:hypothetical protein
MFQLQRLCIVEPNMRTITNCQLEGMAKENIMACFKVQIIIKLVSVAYQLQTPSKTFLISRISLLLASKTHLLLAHSTTL